MKRFTVPTDFNGVSHPFHIYIWDAPNAPVPTDAQFDWVEQARGGRVPEDVRESFRKLHKIAKDNNVSFQDLAVYALGAAQQERAAGTAAGTTGATPARGSAAERAATPEKLRSAKEKMDRAEALSATDRAGALAQLTASIAEVPQAAAYRARALLYESMGNVDAAIADYDAAALDDPQNAVMHNGRCWMRAVANRDLEAGHAACDRALILAPGSPEILDSHGLVLFRLGRFEEARGEYDKAVKSGVRNASFLYGRGMALMRLGRTTEGQADLAAAKAMDATVEKTYADFGIRP